MCDTVAFPAFLGKNSDREPGEPQLVQYATVDTITPDDVRAASGAAHAKPAYIADALPALEEALSELCGRDGRRPAGGAGASARRTYGALLSRPAWMWGAEMGVNEAGVAIGNEAVFSRRAVSGRPLLGMDILRLALHFSGTAAEAARLIRDLVERWGQGGDGGWRHRTRYSNSYLVKDADDCWLLETSGDRVRARRPQGAVGISNTYDAGSGWGEWQEMKRADEKLLFAVAAQGGKRNRLKAPWLSGDRPVQSAADVFALLRTHGGPGGARRRGMGSLCIHTGELIKSETTASLVVHWGPDGPVAWATGSSWPCASIYKPYVVGPANPEITGVHDERAALSLRERRERIGKWADENPERFAREVEPLRDRVEKEMLAAVYDGAGRLEDAVDRAHELEAAYLSEVEQLVL